MKLIFNGNMMKTIFTVVFIIFLGVLYVKIDYPFLFPGLEEKFVWIVFFFGLINFVLYFPLDRIAKNKIKKNHRKSVMAYAFQLLLFSFMAVLWAGYFIPEVLDFLNITYFFAVILGFGAITIFYTRPEKKR